MTATQPAQPATLSSTVQSEALFERAKRVTPGGVNSPVRAFMSVGGVPRFMASAAGAYLTDADGTRYIDHIGSWGPMILGHNHPGIRGAIVAAAQDGTSFGAPGWREVELAELVCKVTGAGKVRFVNSGTEATMSALRLARGYTGRQPGAPKLVPSWAAATMASRIPGWLWPRIIGPQLPM